MITELIKTRFSKAKQPNIYFWRDNVGNEIDAVIEDANELLPIEIKSGKTITSDYFKGLSFWKTTRNLKPETRNPKLKAQSHFFQKIHHLIHTYQILFTKIRRQTFDYNYFG